METRLAALPVRLVENEAGEDIACSLEGVLGLGVVRVAKAAEVESSYSQTLRVD